MHEALCNKNTLQSTSETIYLKPQNLKYFKTSPLTNSWALQSPRDLELTWRHFYVCWMNFRFKFMMNWLRTCNSQCFSRSFLTETVKPQSQKLVPTTGWKRYCYISHNVACLKEKLKLLKIHPLCLSLTGYSCKKHFITPVFCLLPVWCVYSTVCRMQSSLRRHRLFTVVILISCNVY